jgi:DNA-binding NarL/FixJ family response regulator
MDCLTGSDTHAQILILDNQTLFRESLRMMLDSEFDFSVVADSGDLDAAVELAARLRPAIVLLDGNTPGELVERVVRVKSASPGTRALILTGHNDPWMIRTLLIQGIHGYLPKSVSGPELIFAIRAACGTSQRMVFISTAETLIAAMNASRWSGMQTISQRECDILELVSRGLSNAQISKRLSIAEGTVKRHLGNIFVKLGATSRIDAVNRAFAADLLTSPNRNGAERPMPS